MIELPLMALFRPFRTGEFMSAAALKAEVISEESEISYSMSVIRGLSGSVFRPVKTAVHDPQLSSCFTFQKYSWIYSILFGRPRLSFHQRFGLVLVGS